MSGFEDDDFFGGGAAPAPAPAPVTDDFFGGGGGFDGSADAASPPAPYEPPVAYEPPAAAATPAPLESQPFDAATQPFADPVSSGPTPLEIWQEEMRSSLQQRDNDAQNKLDEWKADAQKELQDFYEKREVQIQTQKDANAVAEKEFVQRQEALLTSNQPWEHICSLIDLNNKANSERMSRMRSLLLQLKSDKKA